MLILNCSSELLWDEDFEANNGSSSTLLENTLVTSESTVQVDPAAPIRLGVEKTLDDVKDELT